MAAHSDAKALHIAETVAHQLESEIRVATTSTTTIAEANTRSAVEGIHRDVQVQIEQTRADANRRSEETRKKVIRV